ncbi:hypothetical protein Tco_0516403 [Tanacetum coccineum]
MGPQSMTTAHLCAIDRDCEDFEGPILALEQPISAIRSRQARVVLLDDEVFEDDSSKQGRKLSDEKGNEKASDEVSTAGAKKDTANEEVPIVSTAKVDISTVGGTVTYQMNKEQRAQIAKDEEIARHGMKTKIWDFNQNIKPIDTEHGSRKQKSPQESPEKSPEEMKSAEKMEEDDVVKEPGAKRKKKDVEELYSLVKEKYNASRLEGFDLMLWGDLYVLIFKWLMHSYVGQERNSFKPRMLSQDLKKKLEVDHESSQAIELLRYNDHVVSNLSQKRHDEARNGNEEESRVVQNNLVEEIRENSKEMEEGDNKDKVNNDDHASNSNKSKETYAKIAMDNKIINNKLWTVPTIILNNDMEVVIFNDELVALGSEKWKLTL